MRYITGQTAKTETNCSCVLANLWSRIQNGDIKPK